MLTPVTVTSFTVMFAVALYPPSSVVTVTLAVPFPIPTMVPSPSNWIIPGLLVDQRTVLLVASTGSTVASSLTELKISKV
jgi:hypothetical protein